MRVLDDDEATLRVTSQRADVSLRKHQTSLNVRISKDAAEGAVMTGVPDERALQVAQIVSGHSASEEVVVEEIVERRAKTQRVVLNLKRTDVTRPLLQQQRLQIHFERRGSLETQRQRFQTGFCYCLLHVGMGHPWRACAAADQSFYHSCLTASSQEGYTLPASLVQMKPLSSVIIFCSLIPCA